MRTTGLEIERRIEKFRGAARAAGIKLTHQRLEIFREIASSVAHPDAETIYRAVQVRMPTVSRDTVYRTLWKLHDLGLIATLGARRQSVRFDANLDHHHHYVCTRCGLARDFESHELDAIRVPDAVKEIGSIAGTHVEVRGLCHQCRNEEKADAGSGSPRPGGGGKGGKLSPRGGSSPSSRKRRSSTTKPR